MRWIAESQWGTATNRVKGLNGAGAMTSGLAGALVAGAERRGRRLAVAAKAIAVRAACAKVFGAVEFVVFRSAP